MMTVIGNLMLVTAPATATTKGEAKRLMTTERARVEDDLVLNL